MPSEEEEEISVHVAVLPGAIRAWTSLLAAPADVVAAGCVAGRGVGWQRWFDRRQRRCMPGTGGGEGC